MKIPAEIYEAYRTMPNLQLHQLRVASVAKMVCGAFAEPIDVKSIVTACLFHDMGNIIKSNFDHFPDSFRGPQTREYWEVVKRDYIEKYGSNTHEANLSIARELGLPDEVRQLIDDISFSRLEITRDDGSFEQKISEYADLRVGPHGILSLDDRVMDIKARYAGTPGVETPEDEVRFNELVAAAHSVEQQIFEKTNVQPGDIDDASIASIIDELRDYPIA
jgi:hypothetical protein